MPVFILPPAATAANCSGGPQPDVERSRRLWRASLPQEGHIAGRFELPLTKHRDAIL